MTDEGPARPPAPRAKLRWRVFRRRYREELDLHEVLRRSWEAGAREARAREAADPGTGEAGAPGA